MLDRFYNLEEKRRVVDGLLNIANAALNGEIGPVEAARSFTNYVGRDQSLDKLLVIFIGVDSETDNLPLGDVRRLWNVDALKQKDNDIAAAELLYRNKINQACQKLVDTLSPLIDELRDQKT
jgi:hypothetical protein